MFSCPVQFSPLSSPSSPCDNGTAVSVGKDIAKYNKRLTRHVKQFLFHYACSLFWYIKESHESEFYFPICITINCLYL